MAFTVEKANEADIDKIIAIMFKAYEGKNEYINAVFPKGLTEAGHKMTVMRMLFILSVAPSIWWEKAVDKETGEIVGGTMWNLCEEQKPPPFEMDGPPGTWDTEEEKKYAQALQRSFAVDENKLWAENDLPLLGLAIMAVAPDRQKQGAGTALLQSGLQLADKLHAASIVVSNDNAVHLYEKNGFVTKNERDLDVPEEFGERPKVRIWTMLRQRK